MKRKQSESASSSSNREKLAKQLETLKDTKRRGTSSSFSSKQSSSVVFKNKHGQEQSVNKKKRSELIKHFQANYNKRYSLIQYSHLNIKIDNQLLSNISKEDIQRESGVDRKKTSDALFSNWKREFYTREMISDLTRNTCHNGTGFDLINFPNLTVELVHHIICEKQDKKNPSQQKPRIAEDILNNVQVPGVYLQKGTEAAVKHFHLRFVNSEKTGKDLVIQKIRMDGSDNKDESIAEELKQMVTHSSFAIARAVSVFQVFEASKLATHYFDDYGNYTVGFSEGKTSSFIRHKGQAYSTMKSLSLSNTVISRNKVQKTPTTSNSSTSATPSIPQQPTIILKVKERLRKKNKNQKNTRDLLEEGTTVGAKSTDSKSSEEKQRKKRKMNEKDMEVKEASNMPSSEKKIRKFEEYMPLHNMWKEYMHGTLAASSLINNELLLKVDYHGCIFKVVKSKCGSYIGKEGMMIKETENTFQLLTRDNKVFTIPKNGSVFQFTFEKQVLSKEAKQNKVQIPETKSYQIEIIGTQFCFRSYDRASKRFKRRDVIDL